jgi:hypothetical protein
MKLLSISKMITIYTTVSLIISILLATKMRTLNFKKSLLRLKWDSARNFRICIITNLSIFKNNIPKRLRFNNNSNSRLSIINKMKKWENSNWISANKMIFCNRPQEIKRIFFIKIWI